MIIRCHDCGELVPEGVEVWLTPETRRPDEGAGEPYCPACAGPVGIAA